MKLVGFGKFRLNQTLQNSFLTFGVFKGLKLKAPTFPKLTPNFPKFQLANFSPKKLALTLVVVAVLAAAILIALSQFGKTTTFTQNVVSEIPINKAFQFEGISQNGALTKNLLTMNLQSAQKMKTILIQGKPATAREGKVFLIINLEIANDHQQRLQILPVNLIRLVDTSGKKFAPDVHNENVIVEPISVKKTRIGFVVDEAVATGLSLQVGEIDGPKETISLAI